MKFGQVDVEKYLREPEDEVSEGCDDAEEEDKEQKAVKRGEILLGEHTDMLLVLSGTVYFERTGTAEAQRGQMRGGFWRDESHVEDSSEWSSSEDSSSIEEPFGLSVE